MQIGEKCSKNLFVNMVLEKKLQNTHPKNTFPCLYTWEWVKQIPTRNYSSDDYNYNLQLMEPKVVLPKLTSMNHCHQNYFIKGN